MNNYIAKIKKLSSTYKIHKAIHPLIDIVLTNPDFPKWSGSAYSYNHHYGDGGLIKHTYEVIQLCMVNRKTLNKKEINPEELFLAALYHDLGKIYDYKKFRDIYGLVRWAPNPSEHKRLIHHISRSALMWSHSIMGSNMDYTPFDKIILHDNVLHAILAHHGTREWGSPVAPKSGTAWMLHFCDGISARMDDYNKMDIVKKE